MLLELMQDWYKEEHYPPEAKDIHDDCIQLEYKILGSRRWGNDIKVIYQLNDEFIAVEDVEPATEMQDWGDYGDPQIYCVKPEVKLVEVTEYNKVF